MSDLFGKVAEIGGNKAGTSAGVMDYVKGISTINSALGGGQQTNPFAQMDMLKNQTEFYNKISDLMKGSPNTKAMSTVNTPDFSQFGKFEYKYPGFNPPSSTLYYNPTTGKLESKSNGGWW